MINIKDCILRSDDLLIDAVEKLQSSFLDIILVVDTKDSLKGVITDGDIRKSILQGASIDELISNHMNKNPIVLDLMDLKKAFELSYETNLSSIPVIIQNKLVSLFVREFKTFITYEDSFVSQEKIDDSTIALIMAGGEGKRLRPYTKKIPKSLAKIGNTTLIERNIKILSQTGIKEVYVAVNYLSEKIIDRLGNGEKFNINIFYIEEKEKLGTAGPINYLKDKKFKNLIVLNADIVCNLEYKKLCNFHIKNKNDLTVVCTKNYMPINYGVISTNNKLEIKNIEEKPIKEYWCAAGIYLFTYKLLMQMLPDEISYLDMPDFINDYLKYSSNIKAFPLMPNFERWFDVANVHDLEEINNQDWPHTTEK